MYTRPESFGARCTFDMSTVLYIVGQIIALVGGIQVIIELKQHGHDYVQHGRLSVPGFIIGNFVTTIGAIITAVFAIAFWFAAIFRGDSKSLRSTCCYFFLCIFQLAQISTGFACVALIKKEGHDLLRPDSDTSNDMTQGFKALRLQLIGQIISFALILTVIAALLIWMCWEALHAIVDCLAGCCSACINCCDDSCSDCCTKIFSSKRTNPQPRSSAYGAGSVNIELEEPKPTYVSMFNDVEQGPSAPYSHGK